MRILVLICALAYVCAALPSDFNRIVGGFDAEESSAPYQVSLRDVNQNHFCGGSILNKRWVLTAAHCLDTQRLKYVYAGSNSLSRRGQYYEFEEQIIHESWAGQAQNFKADIALIKVDRDFEFSEKVQTIPLHREIVKGGEKLKVTGWGLTNQSIPVIPDKLQELAVYALTNDDCEKESGFFPYTQLCTFKALNQGVCMGDSGGPLVYNGEQVGVASFVLGGCAKGFPDFFTRVSTYLDWVDEKISN